MQANLCYCLQSVQSDKINSLYLRWEQTLLNMTLVCLLTDY